MSLVRTEFEELRYRLAALAILLDQSLVAFTAVLFNAAVYTYVSWNIVDRLALSAWLILVVVSTVGRFVIQRQWQRTKRPFTSEEVTTITRVYYAGAAVSAVLWGTMGSVLLVADSDLHFSLTIFILAGLTAGVVGSYAIDLPLTVLFVSAMLLPFITRLATEGTEYHALMAGLAALFLVLMIVAARNVSRQARRTVELGLQNEDLVHRLSDASHEIRTPVATIVGFAEVLENYSEATPAVRGYAGIIRRNSTYLRNLVDNVLMLSKAEAGTLHERWERVSLREQIRLAADVVAGRMAEKKITLHIHFEPDVPEFIECQPLKVQQILVNLLANAVKFTEGGQIVVTARREEADLLVRVRDTGIGIQTENQEQIFRPFWREDRREVKSQEGSGLGLALARSLARSMGGELCLVESAPGRGSVFELCLHGVCG